MTASLLFQICNTTALAAWVLLGAAVLLKLRWVRDTLAGLYVPVAFSAVYTLLIAFFFWTGPGGFDSLENVQALFTAPWAALAGWVHYLAFDLFVGARIARGMEEEGLPRWPLIFLLPLTFMLGPIGFLAFEITKAAHRRLILAH